MRIKSYVLVLFVVLTINLQGQTIREAEKVLKKVKGLEQVNKLKEKYPDWKISIDKTMLSDSLKFPHITRSDVGDIVLKQYHENAPKYIMKILKVEDEELCKVKYIYINGNSYSKSAIDSLRTLIIDRYRKREDFEHLVKEYTMDKNSTGDLDWFYKGMMVDEFDNAVRNRTKGEIFTVDVADKKWYYVVLKTHDNRKEKAIKSVKIMYGI